MLFMISDEKKFIVGWSAKCACTSLKKWFIKEHKIISDKNHHSIIGYGGKGTPFSHFVSIDKYKDYKKLLVIRNPYERVVSAYISMFIRNRKNTKYTDTFEQFIKEVYYNGFGKYTNGLHHYTPQTTEMFHKVDTPEWVWEWVITCKNLSKNWDMINKWLGTKTPIEVHNKTDYSKYNIKLNKDLAEMIYYIYKKDFEYFKQLGYTFSWQK